MMNNIRKQMQECCNECFFCGDWTIIIVHDEVINKKVCFSCLHGEEHTQFLKMKESKEIEKCK